MIVAFGLANCELQRDHIQERRIRRRHAPSGEIWSDPEAELVAADGQRPAPDQRLVGASILIRDRMGNHPTLAALREFDKFNCDARRGPAGVVVEYMGR